MQRSWLLRASGWIALTASVWACTQVRTPADADPAAAPSLALRFEDALAPAAFSREGPAIAEAAGGTAGYWAVVPGLPRPERARVVNVATGAEATVALYAGRGGPNGAVRLSGAAAEALGIGDAPSRVRITALRREPRLASP